MRLVVSLSNPAVGHLIFLAEHSITHALPAPFESWVIRVVGISSGWRNVQNQGGIEALLHFRPLSTQLNRAYPIGNRPADLSLICDASLWLKNAQLS